MAAFPETLSLAAGGLRAEIVPSLGGRVSRFWAQEGAAVDLLAPLRRDIPLEAALRRGGCYPLAPFSNRVAEAAFLWKGRRIALQAHPLSHPHALHGIAWTRPFEVLDHTSARIRLQLDHPGDGHWPWPLTILQTFILSPPGLHLELAVLNRAAESQPVGLGFHPFFPRRSAARLSFSATGLWRTGPDLIPTALGPVPADLDFILGRAVPEGLDDVFEGVARTARIDWSSEGASPGWRLTLKASPRLTRAVVFSPPGSDTFCFEPVSHSTNALNAPARPGLYRLAPGATARATFSLAVSRP
jgi:aldose 1-epimerase